ncbi:DUF3592 domain-containing protein [Teredinibacter haidensis]|uniref:DUF3592 domain-containing protein n=1 Tax=Teredinibacter haidensis TaxID=2731755 RepID=UPI000948B4D9|nr:DUF3592 domain-containing protein [Teredinibacter haidensis]
MKMNTLLVCLAVLVTGSTLYLFLRSANWEAVRGKIVHSELKQISVGPNSARAKNSVGGVFDYRADIEYHYTVGEEQYIGRNIYPRIENTFSDERVAKESVSNYPKGLTLTVFYNPDNPGISCLITSKLLSIKQAVILVLAFLFVVAFVVGGIYIFNKL